ncbi:MAG: sodium:solute symporter family transporter [Planctomycetota bacterium]
MVILAAVQLRFPDYFILIGYFVLMLGIGAYFYRYIQRMKDYFSGGNRIPWWLSGVSYYMSCFSVFAFIAYAALAYDYGWLGITFFWIMAPATLVSVLFFSKKWRRARIDSPVEYLETRYSPSVRQLFAWQNIPVRIIDDALKLVAIGIFISMGLDLNMNKCMLWSGLIMLAYTLMGGLWAVTVTDFIQFIVLLAAVIVVLPLSIAEGGGLKNIIENSPEGFFNFTHPNYSWVYLISYIWMFCLAFSSINWSLIQRYYCVPREKDAYKVGWLVVVLNLLGPPLILIPVFAARQFLPDLQESGQVYPLLCVKLLPAGLLGLVIAAMFSATMSMLSSDYNVCASVLTNDVYRRYIRPGASQKELVLIGRLMTLLIGTISLGVAFLMVGVGGEGLFRNMVKLFSVATAPVAIPMIAGLLSRRVTHTGALAGFIYGILSGLALFFLCPDTFEFINTLWRKENIIIWGTTVVTFVSMVVVSRLDYQDTSEKQRINVFLDRLKLPIGQAAEDVQPQVRKGKGGISPFIVVGISISAIGAMMLFISPWVTGKLAFIMDFGVGLSFVLVGAVMLIREYRAGRNSTIRE